MGIYSIQFVDAISSGARIKSNVTVEGYLEVDILDGRNNVVKTYTYEPYIEEFQNKEIAFMDSTEHDAVYWWIKAKVDSGEWPKSCISMYFPAFSILDMRSQSIF